MGYSGHTFRRRRYAPMVQNAPHIPPAYRYRCDYCADRPACTLKCADALEKEVRRQGPDNVAAFIAEPVVGAALAAVPAPDGYFQRIREICTKYDVLFIADEVMTGFGRTGTNFGINHWGVVPDLIATAKGVSGGYTPLGAVIATDEVVEALERNAANFVAGHTYTGNPLSSAVGLAVLRYMLRNKLIENARVQGDRLLQGAQALMERHPIVGDVRGKGLMVGLEFVQDRATKQPFPPGLEIAPKIGQAALERGLISYPLQGCVDGVEGDMMKFTPPMCITAAQVDELLGMLDEAIGAVERTL
jgi:adenosylmethionine-8-amino-7-oxononanoate aminotransferase